MKKVLIPAIGALALIVGFMGIGSETAQAEPSSVLLVNPAIVNSVTGGTFDLTIPDGSATTSLVGATAATVAATCTTDGVDPAPAPAAAGTCGVKEFDQLKGNNDAVLTAAEVTASGVDIDDNQLTAGTGALIVLAFVSNDLTATMTLTNGSFQHTTNSGLTCDATGIIHVQPPTLGAVANKLVDNNCDNAVGTVGDGVIAAEISGAGASAGARSITVTQGTTSQTVDYTVVGGLSSLELIADETTVVSPGTTTCALTAAESAADIAHLHATVFDSAGTALTGVTVTFTSDQPTRVKVASATVLTADNGTDNEALEVACGGTAKGDAKITASICLANCTTTPVTATKTVTITAVGVPAKVDLKADPAQIACDGSASSTVTATVTDSDGKNVADGTAVTFSVVALGTANPINATTKAGVATSKITPLSVGVQGVTVVVSAGSVQSSILVSCSIPVPTATKAAGTPGGGGITPPGTGNGGYLTQDGSVGFPLWTLVALALGSVALVAGGMVTRRAGR